jgi:hypothetical protein
VDQTLPSDSDFIYLLQCFLESNPNIAIPMRDGSSLYKIFLSKVSGSLTWAPCPFLLQTCITQFLTLGADPNTTVKEGIPLLHHCLAGMRFLDSVSRELLMRLLNLADPNLVGGDGNCPLHLLFASYFSNWNKRNYSKLAYISALVDRGADVNKRNGQGVTPLEVLMTREQGSGNLLKYVGRVLEAGAGPMILTSSGKSLFELAEEKVSHREKAPLMKALLEADLASQLDLQTLPNYPPWAEHWRAACREPSWILAKQLVKFERLVHPPPPGKIRDCAFVVIAEHLLKIHKDRLLQWQAGNLEREAVKHDREQYISILKDCNERQADIDPSWYTYLLQIMDF